MIVTKEQLEKAALAAENWKDHGNNRCMDSYYNCDGFLWPGAEIVAGTVLDNQCGVEWLIHYLPEGYGGEVRIATSTPAIYTLAIDNNYGNQVATYIRAIDLEKANAENRDFQV